jgi:hypothetical protein
MYECNITQLICFKKKRFFFKRKLYISSNIGLLIHYVLSMTEYSCEMSKSTQNPAQNVL